MDGWADGGRCPGGVAAGPAARAGDPVVSGHPYFCSEYHTIPGPLWLVMETRARRRARIDLRTRLTDRVAAADLRPVGEIEEGTLYDEEARSVTLSAEVRATCAADPCGCGQGWPVGPTS